MPDFNPPWTVTRDEYFLVVDRDGDIIADCGYTARGKVDPEATARLIAAAPYLYDACKSATECSACEEASFFANALAKVEGV